MTVAVKGKEVTLLPGQAALLWDFKSSLLAAIAGTGGGKTHLGYWLVHSRMEAWPGNTGLIVEPTFNMLSKVLLYSSDPNRPPLFDYLEQVGHHPKWLSKKEMVLGTDFGQIFFGSADRPDSMQGAPVKWVWLDESGQMKVGAHDVARQRVSMLQGQVFHTTTPYNLGALKTDIFDRRFEAGIHVETWSSVDRPGFPKERYEEEKRNLPKWRFDMMYNAKFDRPTGMVYSAFDESTCLVNDLPEETTKKWLMYVGHDFGKNNPCALFYVQDPATGYFYLIHEYLPGPGLSAAQHVEAWKKLTQGYNVVKRIGGSKAGESETRELYTAHGWPIQEPKLKNVDPRIDKVIGLHQLNKIFITRKCRTYLDEKRTFCFEVDDKGQPTGKIENEADFHCMSAEQYILSDFTPETVVPGGRTKVLANY